MAEKPAAGQPSEQSPVVEDIATNFLINLNENVDNDGLFVINEFPPVLAGYSYFH